eukprot:359260-Chlamydomonas_euryale.AAC.10
MGLLLAPRLAAHAGASQENEATRRGGRAACGRSQRQCVVTACALTGNANAPGRRRQGKGEGLRAAGASGSVSLPHVL